VRSREKGSRRGEPAQRYHGSVAGLVAVRRRRRHIVAVPELSIHLIPFLEIVAGVAAVPLIGFFVWRGVRRRRRARVDARTGEPPRLP
jgi:hypothetical protein